MILRKIVEMTKNIVVNLAKESCTKHERSAIGYGGRMMRYGGQFHSSPHFNIVLQIGNSDSKTEKPNLEFG